MPPDWSKREYVVGREYYSVEVEVPVSQVWELDVYFYENKTDSVEHYLGSPLKKYHTSTTTVYSYPTTRGMRPNTVRVIIPLDAKYAVSAIKFLQGGRWGEWNIL